MREIAKHYIVKVGNLYLEKPWNLDYGLKLTVESNAYKFTQCEVGDSVEEILSEVISKLNKQGFSDVKIIEKKITTIYEQSEVELFAFSDKLALRDKSKFLYIDMINVSQIDWDKIFTNTTNKGWSK